MHLVSRGMDRLGRCAASGCETIFADTSRTARQRYCSQPGANRDAVRRHRARQSTPPPDWPADDGSRRRRPAARRGIRWRSCGRLGTSSLWRPMPAGA
ncbi:CGNR zinc finger domain-containing protein [Nonomuraea sp. NPDC050451]|uniref:CGNR zinc finger domain-containing protein n=1 Tax=Nonomuraea sp. NPDC050451 TaxID=3364364 RepID=UPI0037978BB9